MLVNPIIQMGRPYVLLGCHYNLQVVLFDIILELTLLRALLSQSNAMCPSGFGFAHQFGRNWQSENSSQQATLLKKFFPLLLLCS